MGLLDAPAVVDVRGTNRYGTRGAASLLPFRTALAGRAIKPCNVLVIGDSTDEGTGIGTAATLRNQSWPDKLAQLLRARFPTTGETSGAVAPNFVPPRTDSTLLSGWTVTTGTWPASSNLGFGAYGVKSTTAGNVLTYTIPVGATSADLCFVKGTSITGFTYSVDGAAQSAAVGPMASGSTADGATQRITGWDPAATHTLTITSVGTNTYFCGVLLYSGNETAGIRVFNGGHHGTTTYQFVNAGSQSANNLSWMSATPSAAILAGTQSIIPLDPDLIVFGFGYNDLHNTTPAGYASDATKLIAALRAMLPTKTIPVLYLNKWIPATGWTSTGQAPWTSYTSALAGVAAADPLGVYLNLASTTVPNGSTLAGQYPNLYADTVHGKAHAYQVVADQIAAFIAA